MWNGSLIFVSQNLACYCHAKVCIQDMIHLLSQTSDGVTFALDSTYCVDVLKWDFIGQDLILIFVLLIILNNI